MVTRRMGQRAHAFNASAAEQAPAEWQDEWNAKVRRWQGLFATNAAFVRTLRPEDVITIHSATLSQNPQAELRRWCRELRVNCPAQWVTDAASIVYKSPYKARHRIRWPPAVVDSLTRFIRQYSELDQYNFDD